MKLRMAFILLTAFVLVSATEVLAQDTGDAAQAVQNLRGQLSEVQDKEAELKIRLDQLDFDLKPENIERYFSSVGSTRPEELRESRQRQLQTEKDRVVTQLDQLGSSRVRLEAAITNAEAKAYQQSVLGATVLRNDQNLGSHLWTAARLLVGIAILIVVIGSLVLRLLIRRRQHL
jgi:hypothetical protein